MYSKIFVFLSLFAFTFSYPFVNNEEYDLYQNDELWNEEPIYRQRRASGWEGNWDINTGPNPLNPGKSATTFSTGTEYKGDSHSFQAGISATPGVSKSIHVGGSVPIYEKHGHVVEAFGGQKRVYTPNNQEIGRANTGGLKYGHFNGAEASLSGTSVSGMRSTGSFGLSYPLHQSREGSIRIGANSDFGGGRRPNHNFGIIGSYRFP